MSADAWVVGVGMPGFMLLDFWGATLREIFGETAYLVGSASTGKQWRDVDVRIMLDDAGWERWFGPYDRAFSGNLNVRWSGICTAFSLWGQKVTGLPIDFQIQLQRVANEKDQGENRVPLGVLPRPQPWQKEE